MADDWTHTSRVGDVPDAPPWPEFTVGDHTVVLLRDEGGTIHAVRSSCPHLGSPMTRATVTGGRVECARHFYAYELVGGRNTVPGEDADPDLPVHPVEIRDGEVWVRVAAIAAVVDG